MLESQYLVVFGFASVSLFTALALHRWHDDVAVFSAIATGGYGLTALRGDTIIVVSHGTPGTYGTAGVQFYTLGLALISGITLIAAITGRYPLDTRDRDRDGRPA